MRIRDNPAHREYARLAPHYDERWSFYIRRSAEETLRRIGPQSPGAVLDVGCGTGYLLSEMAAAWPGAILTGIDPSPEMLDRAARRLAGRSSLVVGSADALPFAPASIDLIVSTSAFHYIRAPLDALSEMHRVLRPGGRVLLTDWCDDYLACRVCDIVLRLFSRAHFRTYGVASCQRLFAESGFGEVTIERYKIDWLWGMMTAKALKSA